MTEEVKNNAINQDFDPFEEMVLDRDTTQQEKEENPEKEKVRDQKKEEPKPSNRNQEKTQTEEDDVEDIAEKNKKTIDSDVELDRLKKEIEKKTKALTDTQKWGNKNSQKAKNALKIASQLIENGFLTSEEAEPLLKSLNSDASEDQEEMDIEEKALSPLQKMYKIANKELENIRKYTDDKLMNQKVNSFDYFINYSSPEEINEVLEKLNDLKDDPVKMTKEMIAIGQKYYEEVYKNFEEAGGLKQFVEKQAQTVQKLEKKIDKLYKKLQEYEDYNQSPRYRIDEVSDVPNDNENEGDPFEQAQIEKERMIRRR